MYDPRTGLQLVMWFTRRPGNILLVLVLLLSSAVQETQQANANRYPRGTRFAIDLLPPPTTDTCPAVGARAVHLRSVVKQVLVGVATKYFADNAIGDDGFPLVDASLRYNLFDLFEQRYGSATNSERFMAGLTDIFGASDKGKTKSSHHLTAVIGFAKRGDFVAARKETFLLILTSLPKTMDIRKLNEDEVVIASKILKSIFTTIRDVLKVDGYRFQSRNYPAYSFGIKNGNEAHIMKFPHYFKLRSPGLSGDLNSVSFESVSKPHHYLRKVKNMLELNKYEETKIYKQEASLNAIHDCYYKGYTVYESVSSPGYFLRHTGLRLQFSLADKTELFLNDASFQHFSLANNIAFERYLNLDAGSTLALAIDTTLKMTEMKTEIDAIKDYLKNLVDNINMPSLFVLSPYIDSDAQFSVLVTSDPIETMEALQALQDGGDALIKLREEKYLAGTEIYKALLHTPPRSDLFFISGVFPSNIALQPFITYLATIRNIKINTLLTKDMTDPPFYRELAEDTGGLSVKIETKKMIDLFTLLNHNGQVILYRSSRTANRKKNFRLDGYVNSLAFTISTGAGTVIEKITLSIVANNTEILGTSDKESDKYLKSYSSKGLSVMRLERTDQWPAETTVSLDLEFSGMTEYSIEISAESEFGTIAQIKQLVDGEFVSVDQYRAGERAQIEASIFGNTRGVQILNIILTDSTVEQEKRLLGAIRCKDGHFYVSTEFTIPVVKFQICIHGQTAHGGEFIRCEPGFITPGKSRWEMTPIEDQIVKPDHGELEVTITITNKGRLDNSGRSGYLEVSDSAGFVKSTSIIKTGVVPPSTQKEVIKINIPADAEDGLVSKVTALARHQPPTGDFIFISFNIIVKDDKVVRCEPLVIEDGILTCSDGFEYSSKCELTCDPGFVAVGPVDTECDQGAWTVDKLKCKEVGFKECRGTGDPHYLTFDGKAYDFMGTCIYTMVKTTFDTVTGGLEPFKLKVENEWRGGQTHVSYFKQAFIEVYGMNINIRKGRKVTVDELLVNLPFSHANTGLNIELSGSYVVLTTRFGLEVRYNGNSNFIVKLSASYATQVEGLCGNMNDDVNDDLTIPGNDATTDAHTYGNHFQVGGVTERCVEGKEVTVDKCEDRDSYEKICKIIETKCFEGCRKTIPTTTVLQNCIFDMCVTEGNLISYEKAISDYAQQCQLQGISICDWRSENPSVVPSCPPNSQYQHEAAACPNTCRNPNRVERCYKPKVSGCVCDLGYVLAGDVCVTPVECGCSKDGKYFQDYELIMTAGCEQRCMCQSGTMHCEATVCSSEYPCQQIGGKWACLPQSYATCSGSGDPHYTTFDGTKYDFMGACTYTLVRAEGEHLTDSQKFSLDVENEYLGGNKRVSYLKEATFTYEVIYNGETYVYKIIMNRKDGSRGQAFMSMIRTSSDERKISKQFKVIKYDDGVADIQTSSNGVVIKYGQVTVIFNNFFISVTVPSSYKSDKGMWKMKGLCGFYNGEKDDDLRIQGQDISLSPPLVATFAQSWQVGGCDEPIAPAPNNPPCSPAQTSIWNSAEYCGVIEDDKGPFAKCKKSTDLSDLHKDCLYDMCLTDGDKQTLSNILTLVSRKCSVLVKCDWRTQVAAVAHLFVCPENSVYSGCAPGCPATCSNPHAPDDCQLPTEEGCVCKLGYVMHGDKCVKQSHCGCADEKATLARFEAAYRYNRVLICGVGVGYGYVAVPTTDGATGNPSIFNFDAFTLPKSAKWFGARLENYKATFRAIAIRGSGKQEAWLSGIKIKNDEGVAIADHKGREIFGANDDQHTIKFIELPTIEAATSRGLMIEPVKHHNEMQCRFDLLLC